MSKVQKIWMWVFIAMFAVPEILWSPIINFLYTFWKGGNTPVILRDNFLIHSDYRKLAIIIVLLQCLGLLSSLILIYKTSTKVVFKIIFSVLLFVLFLLSAAVFFVLMTTLNMSPF